jgi:predicted nuclease of restriction endonuclease-like RecB superfamily
MKYKAIRTVIDGIKFDSKAEAEYYLYLLQEKKLGLINEIEFHPKVYLTKSKILYVSDFLVTEGDKKYYIDVKGMQTPVFRLKLKLWKHYGAGELRLVKKSGKSFVEIDRITSEKHN